jgi:hypothetical protein
VTKLAPDLFQRRFHDLMEIGRARLPSLAPEWTDYNAHDAGITLMELLAWVGEAQLYSLSRLRRDERVAYAALLGLVPSGTEAASGLIWADRLDHAAPAATFSRSLVIPSDAVINVLDTENPRFRPTHKLLWAPGRVLQLETRLAAGGTTDHTLTNERGSPAFSPFGDHPRPRDVLAMTFKCRDDAGLFGPHREAARGARWAIGVRAAPPLGGAVAVPASSAPHGHSPLTATLVAAGQRVPLRVVSDSTEGLLTTGVLLLDLDDVVDVGGELTLELQSRQGFPRPPRVLRVEPSVVPIVQGRSISRELHVANGTPDWSFELAAPGLRFVAGEEPIELLEVAEADGTHVWQRRDRLAECAPDEAVYELDARAGRITFGNGVNGRVPAAEAQVLVTYAVSDAEQGGVARNRRWKVAGFAGSFGVNPDPVGGGASSSGWIEQRREARRRARAEHPLVTAEDVAAAAQALPLLEVARAWVPPPDNKKPRTGALTLIAMRSRVPGDEPQIPETARWLEAIRGRLAPRMPLGTRLVVSGPRYVDFSLQATVEANPGRSPTELKDDIGKELGKRLALIATADGHPARQPGVPVTIRDLMAWIRGINGVKRVPELRLVRADGKSAEKEIRLGRGSLARFDLAASSIVVNRSGQVSGS